MPEAQRGYNSPPAERFFIGDEHPPSAVLANRHSLKVSKKKVINKQNAKVKRSKAQAAGASAQVSVPDHTEELTAHGVRPRVHARDASPPPTTRTRPVEYRGKGKRHSAVAIAAPKKKQRRVSVHEV